MLHQEIANYGLLNLDSSILYMAGNNNNNNNSNNNSNNNNNNSPSLLRPHQLSRDRNLELII